MMVREALSRETELFSCMAQRASGTGKVVRLVEAPEATAAGMPSIVHPLAGVPALASDHRSMTRPPDHLALLADLVRAVRRKQPPRRTGEFVRKSGWTVVDEVRVFVLWSVSEANPAYVPEGIGADPAARSTLPGDGARSWFERPEFAWQRFNRMAAIFPSEGARLPVLAFDPFSPDQAIRERMFLWSIVDPSARGQA